MRASDVQLLRAIGKHGFEGRRAGAFYLALASLTMAIAATQSWAAWGADDPFLSTRVAMAQSPGASVAAQEDPSTVVETPWWAEMPEQAWTIDYRCRSIVNSTTSYQFGTPEPPSAGGWAPLSRLEFPIDSVWNGFQIGYRRPNWDIHFEWLTPIQHDIHGDLKDYDWTVPDAPFTDLGMANERWVDGQMTDLGLDIRLWNRVFGMPVDLWSTVGFRWQRFSLMCYDALQYKSEDVWLPTPDFYPGDVLSFNQQYYLTYLGGQLRSMLDLGVLPPINISFQTDWANVQAYNVDHHLLREGDRYTMDRTQGNSWHLGLTSEMPVTRRINIGFSADYLQIYTTGRHHHLNIPEDENWTWTNGVRVKSDQTWLTAFAGLRF